MVAGLVSAALMLPGALPHRQGEHCTGVVTSGTQPHAGSHGAMPNNSPDHRQDSCPHCPADRCALQSSCASLIPGLVVQAARLSPVIPAVLPEQDATRLLPASREPPTPPPQSLLRFV